MVDMEKASVLMDHVIELACKENKKTGFLIGNTAKVDSEGPYYTPVRITPSMIIAGAVVYSEQQAIELASLVDRKLDYVIVDAEKKVMDSMSMSGEPANIERAVKETVSQTKFLSYKGNDLTVGAVDSFLAYLYKDDVQGVGGKKVSIIGAGNFGAKLALKVVERGGSVVIARRDLAKLKIVTDALNVIKPDYTRAKVTYANSNEEASVNANILVGSSDGVAVITKEMVEQLASNAIIIDAGKGTVAADAIELAQSRNISVYRLDVGAALVGMVEAQLEIEKIFKNKIGRAQFKGETIIAGGLMGSYGEIVVDSVAVPSVVYGMANGKGDFIRKLSKEQIKRMQELI